MERRFNSPYEHWVSGLLAEISALSAFAAFLIALAVVVVWVVR